MNIKLGNLVDIVQSPVKGICPVVTKPNASTRQYCNVSVCSTCPLSKSESRDVRARLIAVLNDE